MADQTDSEINFRTWSRIRFPSPISD